MQQPKMERPEVLSGIAASRGIGIGKAVILMEYKLSFDQRRFRDVEAEDARYLEAVEYLAGQTIRLARETEELSESEIVRTQTVLLRDPELNQAVLNMILDGSSAEYAVDQVFNRYIELFSAAGDSVLEERISDLKDVKEGLIRRLLRVETPDLSMLPEGSILVARELTPSMTLKMNGKNVAGIVTECGGSTSHAAILSRAMEIPAVLSVPDITTLLSDDDLLIVDGFLGQILIRPKEDVIREYETRKEEDQKHRENLLKYRTLPTKYSDGSTRRVLCNIASPEDMKQVTEYGGEGVGLFRTEYLYMNRRDLPSEDEQTEVYSRVLWESPGEVIIRTLDIGGDKASEVLAMPKEDNPYLGLRAIRFSLKRKDLFRVQLRALLRSNLKGNLKIMLPMVTCREEILEVRSLISLEAESLRERGITVSEKIPLGIMAETPASVLMADVLSKDADFVSIGTNDLTQYLMSADRGNPEMNYLNSAFQPALIRGIDAIIRGAKSAGIEVGMCGEAASDERLIPLLLGLGLTDFSVNPVRVPEVRARICETDPSEAERLAQKALTLGTEGEIRNLLSDHN